jgi:pimeloyl-ACP methyl ester carboxylesterase
VYLVIFYAEPVLGQRLEDVQKAEVKFIEKVSELHPKAESPSVIGNCQGGWASMLIGADRPDVTGPLVIAGSPLSYWSGVSGVNTMRYRGGLTGGTWLTTLLSDLGNGKFDGANLVSGFEDLNPANTYWKKMYHVYANVDTEEKRFLEFERWWGGFFYMTDEEIHNIVNNLFIGNKLEQGEMELGKDKKIKLENLEDPVVMFASKGDNITPPQQALNWIAKVYGSVEEIKRKKQVLVYMVHENIGHLGIFVSGSVAKKEHKEIVESLEQIEYLPPGLYEMIIEEREDKLPGENEVRFEERGIEDILALDDGFEDEKYFPTVASVSETYDKLYRTYLRPWVKLFTNEQTAEMLRQMHPLRYTRYSVSDYNPFLLPIKYLAPLAAENRQTAEPDNMFLQLEKNFSAAVESSLNLYRDLRDDYIEFWFKFIYGNPLINSWFKKTGAEPESAKEQEKVKKNVEKLIKEDRKVWLAAMDKGGFPEGVMRIMLAAANADRKLDRTEFTLVEEIGRTHKKIKKLTSVELKKIAKEQSRILQTDEAKAIASLPILLHNKTDRKDAYKIAKEIIKADGVLADEERMILKDIKRVLEIT